MSKNAIPFRILSFAFALLICFAVLSNPLTADATAVAGAGTAIVDTAIVIGSIVTALGVGPGSDVSVFNTLVNNIISHLNLAKTFQIVTWVVSGCNKSYAPKWLVEAVRSYLFSSFTVQTQTTCSCVLPAGTSFINSSGNTIITDHDYYAFSQPGGGIYYLLYVVNDGTEVTCNGGRRQYSGTINGHYWVRYNMNPYNINDLQDKVEIPVYNERLGYSSDYDLIEAFFNGELEFSPQKTTIVSEGYTAGVIGNEDQSLDDAYPVWMSGAISVPGTIAGDDTVDDVVVVPVTVPGTYPEVTDITQDEAQTGDASVADTTETVGILQTVLSWLSSIWEAITSIPGLISDALTAALSALVTALEALLTKLFVPDVAVINECVADLRAQFPFFDSIMSTGQYLATSISSGDPPVIYAHLDAAEGSYTWGGTVAILDMSFYSRYKSTGDLILSSAMLCLFAWRTFKKLPGIISGSDSGDA